MNNRFLLILIILLAVANLCNTQNVVINEVLTFNVLTIGDEEREYEDWIELYNPSDQAAILTGYYLTDDVTNLTQWQFPSGTEIPARGYLLLWADGQPEQGDLHCDFKLSSESGVIMLTDDDGTTIVDSIHYTAQKADISFGRFPDGQSKGFFFLQPTPGKANIPGFLTFIDPPFVANPSGFYPEPLPVTIAANHIEDEIYYTLDGNDPDQLSLRYTEPFSLSQTTVLKARAFRGVTAVSDVVVRSYFINTVHSLPVLSIATNPADLFSDSIGIYINFRAEGRAWERKTDLHYFINERQKFQTGAGIRIQGNSSVFMAKKSFRLFFREGYGSDRLQYAVFSNTPVQSFKNLVLRAGYDEDITTAQGTLLRDPVISELWRRMGCLTSHSNFGVLYLNNAFWGIYDFRESVNEYFISDHQHISDFDLIRYRYTDWELKYGSGYQWQQTLDFFDTCDLTSDSAFAQAARLIDIDNYTSLHALMHFTQYRSWYYGAYTFKGKYPGAKWQWTIWDMDRAYTDISWNGFDHYHDPNNPYWNNTFIRKLFQNETYRHFFINRHLDVYNTLFRPDNVLPILDSLAAVIAPEIPLEADRWNSSVSKWETNVENLRTFIRQRPDRVLQQMTDYFELDSAVTITVNVAGNGGYLKLSTIDVKQFPWSGKYFPEIPIKIRAIPMEGYKFIGWQDASLPDSDEINIMPYEGLRIEAQFTAEYQSALTVIHPKSVPENTRVPLVIRMQNSHGKIDPFSEPIFTVIGTDTMIALKKGTAGFVYMPQETDDYIFAIENPQAGSHTRTVTLLKDAAIVNHAGSLPQGDITWQENTIHRIDGDLAIPATSTLTIKPGVWILVDSLVNLTVEGKIVAQGTPDAPIIFTSKTLSEPWGGMAFFSSNSNFTYCFFVNGGGDFSKGWAHTGRQPILFAQTDSKLNLDNCFIIQAPGKAIGAVESEVYINRCLIERVFHGGEFHYTHLTCTNSHIMNIPSDDHVFADEDNDGFHIDYVHPATNAYSIIDRSYFVTGKDDAIDHHQARLRVTNTWLEDWMHEGVAASGSDTLHLFNTVVKQCEQGIETGWGDARVFVNHCFVTGNDVGLRFGDSYSREYNGHMTITNSILYNNGDNIKNYINPSGEAVEGAIDISYSITNDAPYNDAPYCFAADPIFTNAFYLLPGSPGIAMGQAGTNMGRMDSLLLITSPVIINEIMYDPAADQNTGDWIELFNPQQATIDLSGWSLKDDNNSNLFHLPPKTILTAQSYLVVCRDTAAFRVYHAPVYSRVGNVNFGLGASDQIRLFSPIGALVDSFAYDETYAMDTEGFTLELNDYYKDNSNRDYWQYSQIKGGTPGTANSNLSGYASPPVIDKTKTFFLAQNYPNPFNQETAIRFSLPEAGKVTLTVYNILGQKITDVIPDRRYAAGNHHIAYNAGNLASGMYFYHLTIRYTSGASASRTRKMILLK